MYSMGVRSLILFAALPLAIIGHDRTCDANGPRQQESNQMHAECVLIQSRASVWRGTDSEHDPVRLPRAVLATTVLAVEDAAQTNVPNTMLQTNKTDPSAGEDENYEDGDDGTTTNKSVAQKIDKAARKIQETNAIAHNESAKKEELKGEALSKVIQEVAEAAQNVTEKAREEKKLKDKLEEIEKNKTQGENATTELNVTGVEDTDAKKESSEETETAQGSSEETEFKKEDETNVNIKAAQESGSDEDEATTTAVRDVDEAAHNAANESNHSAADELIITDGSQVENETATKEQENKAVEEAAERAVELDPNRTIEKVIDDRLKQAATNHTVVEEATEELSKSLHGIDTPANATLKNTFSSLNGNASINETLRNKTIQQAIKNKIEEAIDQKVAEEEIVEGRMPTRKELEVTVRDSIEDVWQVWEGVLYAKRHDDLVAKNYGVFNFFGAVRALDWLMMVVFTLIFLMVYRYVLEWPTKHAFHGSALLIWLAMAGVYYGFVFYRLGVTAGNTWLTGYLLELIFSIENIFVFHAVVKAFRMPRWITQKLLFDVVLAQVGFQMVFYMGLASWLRSLKFLPYIIGVWLLYLGYQAALEDEHADYDIMENRWLSSCLRGRLSSKQDTASIFVTDKEKTLITPVGLLLACLLVADFVLEIDVTVTKIASLDNPYLCFSSSLVASFAVPELFFVARDLFRRFFALKFGISFVLVFCGLQALLHHFVTLTAVVSLVIIISAMVLSVVASVALRLGSGDIDTEDVGPHDSFRSDDD